MVVFWVKVNNAAATPDYFKTDWYQ